MFGVLKLNELLATKKMQPPVWSPDDEEMAVKYQGWCRSQAKTAERFQIQNVADYFCHGTDQEHWDIQRDFPCLAPPYPVFWMEYTQPRLILSSEHGRQETTGGPDLACGFMCVARPLEEVAPKNREELLRKAEEALRPLAHLVPRVVEKLNALPSEVRTSSVGGGLTQYLHGAGFSSSEVATATVLLALQAVAASGEGEAIPVPERFRRGWELEITASLFAAGQPPRGPCYRWMLMLDDRGTPVQHTFQILASRDQTGDTEFVDRLGREYSGGSVAVYPVLMALTFLNCKNVTAVEKTPDVQAERRWRDRHGKPSFRYKVLHIEPMTKAIRQARAGTGEKGVSPLHVCRGHFKDYRSRGLFGKVKGVFWWDHHLRGKAENGVVVKDYDVGMKGLDG